MKKGSFFESIIWMRNSTIFKVLSSSIAKLIQTRFQDPQPFPKFTYQPHCEAYEHIAEPHHQTLSAPPPRIVSTQGRRFEVDTSTLLPISNLFVSALGR